MAAAIRIFLKALIFASATLLSRVRKAQETDALTMSGDDIREQIL
jgi:hypothetical protein